MQKSIYFVYGALCHAMFLAVFLYMAGFLGNFLVPKSVDSGLEGPLGNALLVNLTVEFTEVATLEKPLSSETG